MTTTNYINIQRGDESSSSSGNRNKKIEMKKNAIPWMDLVSFYVLAPPSLNENTVNFIYLFFCTLAYPCKMGT